MLADRVRMSYIKKGGIPDYYVMATDSDFSGTADGEFKYIGLHEYVIIPHIIKGVNVTSYQNMFSGATYLNLKGIASDNPNVTSTGLMFFNFSATTLDLSSFDTSNVTIMLGMFVYCNLTSLDLSSFDTSNVTSMNQMFMYCTNLTSLDLSSFDTSNVTSMNQMFQNCTSLTTAYARTQEDADKFNASGYKPSNVNFVVKPMVPIEVTIHISDGFDYFYIYVGDGTLDQWGEPNIDTIIYSSKGEETVTLIVEKGRYMSVDYHTSIFGGSDEFYYTSLDSTIKSLDYPIYGGSIHITETMEIYYESVQH